MRITLKAIVAAVGVLAMSMQAEALTITAPDPAVINCPLSPVCLVDFGDENSTPDILAAIASIIGPSAIEGYKQNEGDATDSGPGAPYYQTSFFNEPDDPSDALIEWTGGLFFTTNPLYLLVKDGSQSPAYYLFKLTVGGATGWDGKEDLDLQDFWPDQGAISHVSIYGTPGPGGTLFEVPVPDGGSMSMLLGIGLMGLAAARRMLGRN